MTQALPHLFQIGDWRLDAHQNLMWQGDHQVNLEPKSMAILRYLVLHAGEVISREVLFAEFWQNQVVTADALNRVMWNIRRTLADNPNNPQYIATVRNQGYKFVAPVTILEDPRVKQHQQLIQQINKQPSGNLVELPQQSKQAKLTKFSLSAIVIASITLIIFAFWYQLSKQQQQMSNFQRLTYDKIQNIMPTQSRDGNTMVYITKQPDQANKLFYRESAKSFSSELGEANINYSYPVFGGDNKLAVIAQSASKIELQLFDVLTKKHDVIMTMKELSIGLSFNNQHHLLAYSQAHPISGKSVVFTLDTRLKQPKNLTDAGDGIKDQRPKFSPDGDVIAFVRNFSYKEKALFLVDLQGKTQRISNNYSQILGYSWLNNNELLVSLSQGLFKLSIDGELSKLNLSNDNIEAFYLDYNIASNKLLFSQLEQGTQVASFSVLASNKSNKGHPLTQSQANDYEGSVSRNAENLAFVSDRSGKLKIWTIQGNKLHQIKASIADEIFDLRWSPDSKNLAAIAKMGGQYFLVKYHLTSQKFTKKFLSDQAVHLIDWKTNESVFISLYKTRQWQLFKFNFDLDTNLKINGLQPFQGRLTPNKKRLVYIEQSSAAIWLWDGKTAPYILSSLPKQLERNWFVDNDYIYHLQQSGQNKQSQLWQISLDNAKTQALASYPELKLDIRPQKLIYNFSASKQQRLSGDIWFSDIEF